MNKTNMRSGPNGPEKRCSQCGDWFPATTDYFHKWAMAPGGSGLTAACKTCRRATDQKYRDRKKAERIDAPREAPGAHNELRERLGAFDMSGPERRPYRCLACRDTWETAAEAIACCDVGGGCRKDPVKKQIPLKDEPLCEIGVKLTMKMLKAWWTHKEIQRKLDLPTRTCRRYTDEALRRIAAERGCAINQVRNWKAKSRKRNGDKPRGVAVRSLEAQL